MQLNWTSSRDASVCHTLAALLEGKKLSQPQLAASLLGSMQRVAEIAPRREAIAGWVQGLIPAAAKSGLEEALASYPEAFMLAVSQFHVAYEGAMTESAEQLALRVTPIREQWEGRGPGLLHALGKRLNRPLASAADVIIVHPALGGGGACHPADGAVHLEGMLFNPLPELPEIVRLAWLLAQLPSEEGAATEERNELLEHVLAAAEYVELVGSGPKWNEWAREAWGV